MPDTASQCRSDDDGVTSGAKVRITLEGVRDEDAALGLLKDMLSADILETGGSLAASLEREGAGFTANFWICCESNGKYYWCPGDPSQSPQMCYYKGEGCPA